MILELSLPLLPDDVKQKLMLFAQTLGHTDSSREWLEKFHNTAVNVVNHNFEWCQEINADVAELLQPYFPNEEIVTVVGVMRNTGSELAWLTPHCDRLRHLAINLYIELGGDNVQTKFYDYVRTNVDQMSQSENLTFDSINEIASYRFELDRWYCYSVQQCHAVSGIESTRIFLGLILKSNPTIEQIKEKYPNIVKEQLCTF